MAVIDQYTSHVLAGGQIDSQASGADFGAGVGASVQNVGQGLSDVSQGLFRVEEDQARIQASTDVEDAKYKATVWYDSEKAKLDPLNDKEYMTKLQGLQEQFQQHMGEMRTDYLSTNGNRMYQRAFNSHMNTLTMSMMGSVHSDIAQSSGAFFKSTFETAFNKDLNSIRDDPSNENISRVVQKQLDNIGATQTVGFTDAHKLQLRDEYLNRAAWATYSARAASDPYAMYQSLGIKGAADQKYGPKGGSITQSPDASAPTPQPSGGFGTPNINTRVAAYAGIAASAGKATGVDPNFLLAQVQAESAGDSTAVSPAGAKGVSQFMPGTAAMYNVDPTNTTSSINGQAKYMADLLKQFGGDYRKAAAAYNWGPASMQNAVAKYGNDWLSHAPTETQMYLKKIFGSLPAAANGAPSGPGMPPAPPQATDADFSAADSQKMGGLWDHLTDQQRVAVGRMAEQGIRADGLAQAQNAAMAEKAAKMEQAKVNNQFLDKLIDGTLNVDEIRSNTTLDASQREHWYNAIQSQTQKQDRTDPAVFNDLYARTHLPDNDPRKITDPDDLTQYMGKGISFADVKKLQGEVKGRGTPDAELLTQFKSMAKSQISGSSLIAKDPDGDKSYYMWNSYVDNVIAQKQKEGVSLHQLLDPSDRNYIGTTINRFVRNPQQQMKDMATRMQPNSSGVLPPDQVRKPGETIDAWMARTGGKK